MCKGREVGVETNNSLKQLRLKISPVNIPYIQTFEHNAGFHPWN
jgi:hypothetical protein